MSAQPLPPAQEPDVSAALDFLERRFGDIHMGYAVPGFIRDDILTHEYVSLQSPDRWERATRIIAQYADTHDCYLAAAVFGETTRRNAATGKNEYRTTDMIAFVPVLYTERDQHPYPDTLPPPSYTVETSTGSFQDYFTLATQPDAETAGRYLRRIAAACGIGNQAVDAARLLRLPGTINRKPERAGEVVRIVEETGKVYSLADFDDLPDVAPIPTKNGNPSVDGKVRFVPGERRAALLRLAGAMRRVGADENAIRAALEQANEDQCDPPLPDAEVQAIARDIPARYAPAPPDPVRITHRQDEPIPLRPEHVEPVKDAVRRPLTDLGNAERLVDQFGENLRYVVEQQGWISYQGTHWASDDTGDVYRYAKEAVRGIYGEAAHEASDAVREATGKHAIRSEATARIEAMVKSASREKTMPIRLAECDADLWMLNVLNGTIDLRTGELRPHRRADFITKIAPVHYDPAARLDLFDPRARAAPRGDPVLRPAGRGLLAHW